MQHELSEQEIQRRNKLEKLREAGIDPYPAELFKVDCNAEDILENYEKNKIDYKSVSIAGRIMRQRIMGKAAFFELQDSTARIQLYFNRDEICPGEDKFLYNEFVKKLLDSFCR